MVCEAIKEIICYRCDFDLSSYLVTKVNLNTNNRQLKTEGAIPNLIKILFFINTPHICGQKIHQPHAGLQRKLAKSRGMIGKFPLHAWTELTLWCDADDMRELASDEAIESHYSGKRCQHFVRSFLRWRRGQLERVKAHWRGDPALGMKRTRYVAKPANFLPAAVQQSVD
jgi:hypothetical protein